MVDKERREFLKKSLNLLVSGSVLAATSPLNGILKKPDKYYASSPILKNKIPEDLSFSSLNSIIPQLLVSSAMMTFLMTYADNLQMLFSVFISVLLFIFIGLPISEFIFGYLSKS